MSEILLDPLGALVITFFVMSIISVISLVLLFIAKNEKLKKRLFYFLSVWAVIIAYCNVRSLPGYWIGEIMLAFAIGALGIAGLLFNLISKKENKFQIASIMVAVSVAAGMIDCFFF